MLSSIVDPAVSPDGSILSFDAAARRLYVGTAEGVAVLNDAGTPVGFLKVPMPRAVVVADPLRMGFVAGGADNSVTVFNPADLKTVRSIPTGAGRIDAMVMEPRTSRLFVASGPDLDVIDVASGEAVDRLEISGSVHAMTIDGAGRVFAALKNKPEIAVIDAKTDTVRERFAIGDNCDHPGALVIDDINRHLFVACGGASLTMLDTDYGHIEGSIPAGVDVMNMVFDPGVDRVFACTADGGVATIGPSDHGYAVLSRSPDVAGSSLALNAARHALYTLRRGGDGKTTLSILKRGG